MTNEDMLYTSVWEKLCDSLLANTRPPIEEAALLWAARKVREHGELYKAVAAQTLEIDELNEEIEDLTYERDEASDEANALQAELDNAIYRIQDLENELQAAREPKID